MFAAAAGQDGSVDSPRPRPDAKDGQSTANKKKPGKTKPDKSTRKKQKARRVTAASDLPASGTERAADRAQGDAGPRGNAESAGAGRPMGCSVLTDRVHLPAIGTASRAAFWIAYEQPGSWPAKGAGALARDLARACSRAHGRAVLIRRPGRHPSAGGLRRAYLAGGLATASPWLISADVVDDRALLDLPWPSFSDSSPNALHAALLAAGAQVDAGAPATVLLVCTNGTRDTCCAVRGRPVATIAAAARPEQVWECTHIGGHQFAPTGVLLPYGATLARLDADLALQALDSGAQGRLPASLNDPSHDRGPSHLGTVDQVRICAVRHTLSEPSLTALRAEDGTVVHDDGRRWQVYAARTEGPRAPSSCGKSSGSTKVWTTTVVTVDQPART